MYSRILIPLDGSALAEKVIPHAEQFARIFGSTIVLLQVLDPIAFRDNPNPVNPLNWQIRKTEADMYLHNLAARISEDLPGEASTPDASGGGSNANKIGRVEYHILEGKTAESIVNFAHSENIELLIICSHGSGGLSKWNISSVTQKVINMIYLPFLLVRAFGPTEPVFSRIHYRRILLPIDSSRRAECALAAGVALAKGEVALVNKTEFSTKKSKTYSEPSDGIETKLLLTAVIKPPELPIPEPLPAEIESLSQQLVAISRRAVSEYLTKMGERLSVNCETIFVEDTSVASAIHDLANQNEDIDLIILCAHGYTGKFTWPYGSVASNYIQYGTKPVLVVQDVPLSKAQITAFEFATEKNGAR